MNFRQFIMRSKAQISMYLLVTVFKTACSTRNDSLHEVEFILVSLNFQDIRTFITSFIYEYTYVADYLRMLLAERALQKLLNKYDRNTFHTAAFIKDEHAECMSNQADQYIMHAGFKCFSCLHIKLTMSHNHIRDVNSHKRIPATPTLYSIFGLMETLTSFNWRTCLIRSTAYARALLDNLALKTDYYSRFN